MEIYLPSLEAKMIALVSAFRFIVFAIMVAGVIFFAASGRGRELGLVIVLGKAIVVVAAVATMDLWFPKVESLFIAIADYIDPRFSENPTSSADTIRDSTTTNPEGQEWSWRRLNESIYQAVSNALANVFIYIGTLMTVPMLILQYVLRWLMYLIAPFALAIFMLPGFASIGVRFFQQLLAILAWPIGFALTNLVALAVWNDFRDAVGANPETVGDVLYSPLLTYMGGILATIVIIVGMVSTPLAMQMLFAQGYAFTGASANPVTMMRTGMDLVRGIESRMRHRGASNSRPAPSLSSGPFSLPPPPLRANGRLGI